MSRSKPRTTVRHNMLYKRIITALPLAILAVWFIITQSTSAIFYGLLLINLIAGWEWARLSGLDQRMGRVSYALLIVASSYGLYWLQLQQASLFNAVMVFSIIWWSLIIYYMSTRDPSAATAVLSPLKVLSGFFTLLPPVLALLFLHQQSQGAYWMLYVLSIVWVADSGAYFAGKTFGKVKLVPKLSPGKTREGLYGAVLATSLYSMAAAVFFDLSLIQTLLLLIISFFGTLLSIAGDLFISLLKRERGVKDTGAILPGHGGVLDRIDSITSAAPFFAILLNSAIFHV
ncbi:MAG: phosphatidate cytidylyltransferase [Gammaproteobacteria bacterium]|nr:phosphatidate cytidylyltransferase [Gammaproteobacteria bacterium]